MRQVQQAATCRVKPLAFDGIGIGGAGTGLRALWLV